MEITRSEKEIDRLESWAAKGQNKGTRYNGMSYEDGIRDAMDWLFGRRDSSPADEE